jgi:hypothetical protein
MKKKLIDLLPYLLIGLIIMSFPSCSSYIYKSGNYCISSIENDTVTFYKIKGKYLVKQKDLKINDTVYIKIVYNRKKANTFLLNSYN